MSGLAGFDRQAGDGRSEEDHIVSGGDEVQVCQVGDLIAFDAGCVGEFEVVDGFAGGELRGFILLQI